MTASFGCFNDKGHALHRGILLTLLSLPVLWIFTKSAPAGTAVASSGSDREDGLAATVNGPEWRVHGGEARWNWIVLHHSGTESGSVPVFHQSHRSRTDAYGNPWLGIGYHFVIGNGNGQPDGTVAATFRWEEQIHGAHSGDAAINARGIGICLVGDFESTRPTGNQLTAVKSLVRTLSRRHDIPLDHIIGHSAVRATSCPGRHFPLDEVRQSVRVR